MGKITLGTGVALALTVLAFGTAGCASHNQETAQAAAAGAEMQHAGVMSQSSYIRARELSHSVSQTHAISDTDLNWTLAELTNEKNAIARARAFNTLASIRPMSAAQRNKIVPAITPYLSSTDKLDQIGAQRVQKATQTSS